MSNRHERRRLDTLDTAAPKNNRNARLALMKAHESEVFQSSKAHAAANPAALWDVVVAHRGDVIGVKFHDALAAQHGKTVMGDVGVFCVDRRQVLALLDAGNPDVASKLRETDAVTVVCFAYQGITIYILTNDDTAPPPVALLN